MKLKLNTKEQFIFGIEISEGNNIFIECEGTQEELISLSNKLYKHKDYFCIEDDEEEGIEGMSIAINKLPKEIETYEQYVIEAKKHIEIIEREFILENKIICKCCGAENSIIQIESAQLIREKTLSVKEDKELHDFIVVENEKGDWYDAKNHFTVGFTCTECCEHESEFTNIAKLKNKDGVEVEFDCWL